MEAGLSLAGLAKVVHYSRSHLSKVETGLKPPSDDLMRRCDAALACDGQLHQLAGRRTVAGERADAHDTDEVWTVRLNSDGGTEIGSVSRRQLITGGAMAALGLAMGTPKGFADAESVAAFRVMFEQLRGLGQRLSPAAIMPSLVVQTHAMRSLAGQAVTGIRTEAWQLAARYAEFTSWMAQEAGDDRAALWWIDRSADLALAAGDVDASAYAWVRRGLVALNQGRAEDTIALAQRATAARPSSRVLALAAAREAQGHALAGDRDACLRAIDRLGALATQAAPPGPIIGTSNVADQTTVTLGWCLFDLGRPAEAATVLQTELDRMSAHAYRARARYATRLALAYAGSGEPERACLTIGEVLDRVDQLSSATLRIDLLRLSNAINRWHRDPLVRATRVRLNAAIQSPV